MAEYTRIWERLSTDDNDKRVPDGNIFVTVEEHKVDLTKTHHKLLKLQPGDRMWSAHIAGIAHDEPDAGAFAADLSYAICYNEFMLRKAKYAAENPAIKDIPLSVLDQLRQKSNFERTDDATHGRRIALYNKLNAALCASLPDDVRSDTLKVVLKQPMLTYNYMYHFELFELKDPSGISHIYRGC